MSTISNIHTAIVYESKGSNKSTPYFGQRGVVTIAKPDKDGNYGQHLQQTMFTSIPQLAQNDLIDSLNDETIADKLLPHLVDYLQTIQNKVIADNLKAGHKNISSEQLEIASLINYLNAENTSDKWDSARIAEWFNETLAESIGTALMEKGFTDEKMEQSLIAYSQLFSSVFSSKAVIPRIKATAISKALALIVNPDSQTLKFKSRIDKILTPVENMNELLGL